MNTIFFFFCFYGSDAYRWFESRNHEQVQKIRILRYYFIDETDYMVVEFKTTYSSHKGLEEKIRWHYDKLWDSKKKIVVLIRKESR